MSCGRKDGHDESSSRLCQLFENEKKLSQTFTVPKKRTKKEVASQPHGALNLISPPQKLMQRNNYTSFLMYSGAGCHFVTLTLIKYL